MSKPSLTQIANRIAAHLNRFERDPRINARDPYGTNPYYNANAHRAGARVMVVYISYQGASSLARETAARYLAWLDAGNIGTHYHMPRESRHD